MECVLGVANAQHAGRDKPSLSNIMMFLKPPGIVHKSALLLAVEMSKLKRSSYDGPVGVPIVPKQLPKEKYGIAGIFQGGG